jgi:sulfur transfer complex TusBCD TusB component (DsrH family)
MWYVILTGDGPILKSLSTEKNSSIEKSGNEFVLKIKEFETYDTANDIRKLACDYLEALNGILFLEDGIRSAIKINSVYQVNNDNSRNIYLFPEPGVIQLRGFAPTVTITKDPGESTVSTPYQMTFAAIEKSRSDEPLQNILKAIENGEFDYPVLSNIIEILQSVKGAKLYEWESKSKIDLLMRTSQSYRHGISRFAPLCSASSFYSKSL